MKKKSGSEEELILQEEFYINKPSFFGGGKFFLEVFYELFLLTFFPLFLLLAETSNLPALAILDTMANDQILYLYQAHPPGGPSF